MKNLKFFGLFLVVLGATLTISCNEEETTMNDSNSKILKKSFTRSELFTYATDSASVDSLYIAMSEIASMRSAEFTANPDATHIIHIIDIGSGVAKIREIHYLDADRDLYLQSLIGNSSGTFDTTNELVTFENDPWVTGLLFGPVCPPGTEYIGWCSTTGSMIDYMQCIGNTSSNYQMANLDSYQNTIIYTQSNWSGGSSICAGSTD